MDKNYDFDAERALEQREMLKGLHPQMKTWYLSANAAPLQQHLGTFPQFWQDLEGWKHFAVTKKMYFIISERYGSSKYDVLDVYREVNEMLNPAPSEDVAESTAKEGSGEAEASTVPPSGTSAPIPKKKNRWGAPQPVDEAEIEAAAAAASQASTVTPTATAGKRNRWGAPVVDSAEGASSSGARTTGEDDSTAVGAVRKKPSRWSSAPAPVVAGSVPASVSAGMASLPPEAVQQSHLIQMQVQKLTTRLAGLAQEAKEHDLLPVSARPASPAPIYNSAGVKVNTYEVRMRESLTAQRNKLIEEMVKLNPFLPPPPDYVKPKPQRKMLIPVDEFPDYNFIGLIIGPRGLTQKRLEQQTGCRISIRGKGSMGRGGKSSANVLTSSKSNSSNDENEPLHVYISGETEENVSACAKVIQEILVPVDDDQNEHKQKQLKELALINGTLQVEDFCDICGLKGHRQYECPSRSRSFKAANVKCALCGEMSHPTRDCPLRENASMTGIGGGAAGATDSASALDSEYLTFMAELDGKKPPTPSLISTAAGAGSDAGPRSSSGKSPNMNSSSNGGPVILTSTLFTKAPPPPGGTPAPGSAGSAPKQAPVVLTAKLMTGLEEPPPSVSALTQKSPSMSPAMAPMPIPALPPAAASAAPPVAPNTAYPAQAYGQYAAYGYDQNQIYAMQQQQYAQYYQQQYAAQQYAVQYGYPHQHHQQYPQYTPQQQDPGQNPLGHYPPQGSQPPS